MSDILRTPPKDAEKMRLNLAHLHQRMSAGNPSEQCLPAEEQLAALADMLAEARNSKPGSDVVFESDTGPSGAASHAAHHASLNVAAVVASDGNSASSQHDAETPPRPTAPGFDHHRWRDVLAEDLRDRPQPSSMVLERYETPAGSDIYSVRRLVVVSALIGVSLFGAGAALAMRSAGKPMRPTNDMAMIQIEQPAVTSKPAEPTTLFLTPKLVKTTPVGPEAAMTDPNVGAQPSAPAAQSVAPTVKPVLPRTRAEAPRVQKSAPSRKAAATSVPRPPELVPNNPAKLSGLY